MTNTKQAGGGEAGQGQGRVGTLWTPLTSRTRSMRSMRSMGSMQSIRPRLLPAALMALALGAIAPGVARAQWLTQSVALKAGWNAMFLHVDMSHVTLDELLASDANGVIQEVWLWKPELSAQQFVDSPQDPVSSDTRWVSWSRSTGEGSYLRRMGANFAYLVKVKNTVPTYTWALKGKPVAPSYQWTTSGMNFIGFSSGEETPPSIDAFLGRAPQSMRSAVTFYQYPGGDLGSGNPARVFALRTTPLRRGEAFWIQSGDYYNRYFGPFEVSMSSSGQVMFGDALRASGIRINNLTTAPLTLRLGYKASETAPSGQPTVTGIVPLLIRGTRNAQTGAYAYTQLTPTTPSTWTLAAAGADDSSVEIVLGADRSAMTGNAGDLLAGVLQLSDGTGQSRVDLGVSAVVGNTTGLWVGGAAITQVGQYLKKYAKNPDGQLAMGTNGQYQVLSTDTNLTGVAAALPMRVIVHNPATGTATLFQRLFTGVDVQTNAVVARHEAVLDARQRAEARRISAPHLPFTTANAGWNFNGRLVAGATVTTSVTNRFDDGMSNPFVHTYHPDHDNLNARFTQTVPQGSESYTVVRDITLQIMPPSDDFAGRTSVGETLAGIYAERIRVLGLARGGGNADTRTFDVKGDFILNRLSPIPAVRSAP